MPEIDLERETQPIGNFWAADRTLWSAWLAESSEMSRAARLKSVAFHRARLGAPSRIAIGHHRYTTWDRSLWTAYVNNDYGVKLELPTTDRFFTKIQRNPAPLLQQAVAAWHDYRKALGFESKLVIPP